MYDSYECICKYGTHLLAVVSGSLEPIRCLNKAIERQGGDECECICCLVEEQRGCRSVRYFHDKNNYTHRSILLTFSLLFFYCFMQFQCNQSVQAGLGWMELLSDRQQQRCCGDEWVRLQREH